MEIDIRDERSGMVDTIRVSYRDLDTYIADVLRYDPEGFRYKAEIADSDSNRCVGIRDKDHAENLIKGLQKAIQLGWFD